MKALAEIQVIPIGVGVSVRKEVIRAHEIIRDSGLTVRLHAYGTKVEGDLDAILAAIERVHETLSCDRQFLCYFLGFNGVRWRVDRFVRSDNRPQHHSDQG